ncbi:DUF805 domain-containing protein [Fructilactobacillus lindneri]|uniref:DUF805 domain-containing protein n=2 Tax=Fructilactobacillus lindneri TaxID=53444 RepID=A0A0R2K1U2_9LACO|nr:DUF805 domain-containing protein [Fructilactobacillus lindneri]KRN80455.1 hypothetical protein IV52_GL000029 [Fructilactobacillus lindneri DSM 20690 = JCM 11027]
METSFKDFYTNLFHISGRMSRAAFWWAYLDVFIIVFIIDFFINLTDLKNVTSGMAYFVELFLSLIVFILGIGVITATCRRLHDTNKSAWWFWLHLIPFAGSIALLVLCAMPTINTDNRFGQPDVAFLNKLE